SAPAHWDCRGKPRSANETITGVGAFDDAATRGEHGEALVESGVTNAAFGAPLGEGDRGSGVGERCRDALIQRTWHGRCGISALDELEGEGLPCLDELDLHGFKRRCRTVLDREGEGIAVTAQIEIAVTPGVELRRATQRLAGTDVAGTLLGMVDDEDGKRMLPLQLTKIGKQGGD